VHVLLLLTVLTAGQDFFQAPDLLSPATRAQLRLTVEQDAKIRKLVQTIMDESLAYHEKFEAGKPGYTKDGAVKVMEDGTPKVAALLTKEQRQKLNELIVQRAGVRIFLREGVAESFNLVPETLEMIRETVRENDIAIQERQAFFDARDQPIFAKGITPEAAQKLVAEENAEITRMKREMDAKILKQLTKNQKAKFAALQGKEPVK
jgi:hypothetical protein